MAIVVQVSKWCGLNVPKVCQLLSVFNFILFFCFERERRKKEEEQNVFPFVVFTFSKSKAFEQQKFSFCFPVHFIYGFDCLETGSGRLVNIYKNWDKWKWCWQQYTYGLCTCEVKLSCYDIFNQEICVINYSKIISYFFMFYKISEHWIR